MNAFLISNDPSLSLDKIDQIQINSEDIICLFNHANPLKFNKIFKHKQKYLFLRYHKNSYWGLDEAIKYKNFYEKIFLINYNEESSKLANLFLNKPIFIEESDYHTSIYPNKKSPTSGFVGYNYVLQTYTKNIFLVNFTGYDPKNKFWKKHDYDFEQQYYKSQFVTML